MNRENLTNFKVIIVGAGASGLTLAIKLSKKYKSSEIAIIEKLDRVGKKLLSTGNGRCNLSNVSTDLSHFHSENNGFCNKIINNNAPSLTSFYESLGVLLTTEGDRVYPLSKQASSVVDALRFKIQALEIPLFLNREVIRAKKQNNAFILECNTGEIFTCDKLVFAVGGSAQKHFGTDGKSYELLKAFGHTKTKILPSIVQLKTDLKKVKGLKGLKQEVLMHAILNGKEITSFLGEVLFTEYGVSGNATFYLSSYLVGNPSAQVKIDFCPSFTESELKRILKDKKKACPYLTGEHILNGIIPNKIASAVLRNSNFTNLNDSIVNFDTDKIASIIKNYYIDILGSMGFDLAQVTKGGINTLEFSNDTLESLIVPSLYACGEVLDVDGDCGGFNLLWAYCSATAIFKAI